MCSLQRAGAWDQAEQFYLDACLLVNEERVGIQMPVRPQLLVQQLAALSQPNLNKYVGKVQECIVPHLTVTQKAGTPLKVAHEVGHAETIP